MYGLSDLDLAREINRDRLAFAETRRALAITRAARRKPRAWVAAAPVAKASPRRAATAGPVGCTA